MQYCGEAAVWVNGDVDGKVAQFDLASGWAQRPLIWQEDGTVGADAGQIDRSRSGLQGERGEWDEGAEGGDGPLKTNLDHTFGKDIQNSGHRNVKAASLFF